MEPDKSSVTDNDTFAPFHLRAVEIGVQTTALLVILGFMFFLFYGPSQDLQPITFGSVLLAGAVGAIIVWRLPWPRLLSNGRAIWFFHLWAVTNIMLVSIAVNVTGGPRSDLYILYGLTTIFFAAVFPGRDQLALFGLTVLSYLTVVAIHQWAIPPSSLLIRLGFLGMLAFLGSFLARELMQQMSAHKRLAMHDPLTGLANRNLFRQRAIEAVEVAKRDGHYVAIMMLDLDGFKEINDTLGHPTGDMLLQLIGERLCSGVLRDTDTIARLGGDEFAVLLPKISDPEFVLHPASRIVEAFRPAFSLPGLALDVRASVGIAVFPDDGQDVDVLIQRADVAMYVSKEGRTPFEVYKSDLDHHSPTRLSLVADLRRAVEEGGLSVHYQPKVEVTSGRVVGVEALARWTHPQAGNIPPDQFIPLAERSGFIQSITKFVLNEALKQAKAWEDEGNNLSVAVNLSIRDLQDEKFPAEVAQALTRWQVPADRLHLEITEHSVMADPARVVRVLGELRAIGVRFALDDFGTGYASLGHLARLPVDQLKIDKTLVMRMELGDRDAAIVKSTIDLARNLQLEVVAEGVETESVLAKLNDLGCDMAQGFLLSRPKPASELHFSNDDRLGASS